jgi:DNA-binding beta-propeller fold protein YncE
MMDDQLVELDTRTFEVSRRFCVGKANAGPIAAVAATDAAAHAGHAGHHPMPPVTCSPTWAQPSADGKRIYAACNKSDEILEIDRDKWTLLRRLPTGRGPYNLAVTPDGKLLVATLKQGAAVEVFDLATGRSVMREKSSTTVTHGVAISSDSRYAFVSSEGVGAAPGKVDAYDLQTLTRVGSVDVGQQAGGIAFWKMQ